MLMLKGRGSWVRVTNIKILQVHNDCDVIVKTQLTNNSTPCLFFEYNNENKGPIRLNVVLRKVKSTDSLD